MFARTSSALACALLVTACAGTQVWEENCVRLEYASAHLDDEELIRSARRLEWILADTQEAPQEFALQRFYASFLLAQVHARASLDRPFFEETSTAASRVGGIGRRETTGSETRPSIEGHVAASVYYASLARGMYDRAARSGPKHGEVTLLPDDLWNTDLNNADANLQIILTTAYARLGFSEEVAKILDESPDLVDFERCEGLLTRYGVLRELRPWIFAMIFDYLKVKNEESAYPFAILAVEGADRYGFALPARVTKRIDHWIVDEASVVFVCPESRTAYIPGAKKSPISGIAQLDYVPMPRPAKPAERPGE